MADLLKTSGVQLDVYNPAQTVETHWEPKQELLIDNEHKERTM